MAEEMYERMGERIPPAPPLGPLVTVAPPNIDVSPHVSIAMPRSPYVSYFAMSRVMSTLQDLAQKLIVRARVDQLRSHIPLLLSHNFSVASEQFWAGPEGDHAKLREAIINDYQGLFDNWQSGIMGGVGTAYSSAMEQFLSTGQLLYAYKTLMYQTAVTPRMRRHWNRTYMPTVPNTSMAYSLLLRGAITDAEFETYASYDGWSKENVEFLKTVWQAVPSVSAAFNFLMRNQITRDEFDSYVGMSAWPEGWADKFLEYYKRFPTSREAFKLWNMGKIDDAAKKYMYKANGFQDDWHGLVDLINQTFPTLPQAAYMYLRSALSKEDYAYIAKVQGYDPAFAERMMANFLNYPSTREAFYMHRRAIIDEDSRNKIYQARGYLSDWWPLISENYQHIPNPLNAFKMMMRGQLSRGQFDTYIYQNGWLPEFTDKFYSLYENTPTSHEAFFMWKKGIIDVDTRNALYQKYGWDKRHWTVITKNYEYIPTLYDLFRIADYVEIDPIWATEVLRKRGISDEYITKMLPMLKIRPLRDDIYRQIAIWVNRYKLGWCDATELEAALDAMLGGGLIQQTEKTLITEEAELKYEDELLSERITILMWKFRMAAITEDYYLQALLDLGIRLEKANLMVEEQVAMGYYGYY